MAVRRAFTQQGNLLKLSGDTFTIKDELKRIGARFDGSQKCWFIASEDETLKKLEFLGFLPVATQVSIPAAPSVDSALVTAENDGTWSVLQFTLFIERLFKQQLNFDFWIVGEVSSLKTSSGHVYFDLTEPDSEEQRALTAGRAVSVSCCLWAGKSASSQINSLNFRLPKGLKLSLRSAAIFARKARA